MITERGLVHEMDERVYHSDPVEGGSLSSTGAKEILRSPAHYRHYIDSPRDPKPQFDFGSAVHTLVLGVGWDIEPLDFDSWRTKEAKETRAEVESQGKVALLQKDFDRAEAVAISVLEHPSAGKLFRKGDPEVSAFGQHRSGTWLRGRFDWLVNGTLIDLKTVQSADPRRFNRTVWDYSYDVQAAHYMETYRLATGERPKGFIHVLVEKEPPYAVSVARLDPEFLDLGERRLERAIASYKTACDTGQWGGYPQVVHTIEPLPYMTYQEDDE